MWGGVTPDLQLYDLDDDHWEQSDLADEKPDVVSRLEGQLLQLVERYQGDGSDSLRSVAVRGPAGYRAFSDDFEGVRSDETE